MDNAKPLTKVLIAGIGGASLGTEIAKCLAMAQKYEIYGCDISNKAFGHFDAHFAKTFVVSASDYVTEISQILQNENIEFVIPGSEPTMKIFQQNAEHFKSIAQVIQCDSLWVDTFSNKAKSAQFFKDNQLPAPQTYEAIAENVAKITRFPCIIKPSCDSGGSDSVFFANDRADLQMYIEIFNKNQRKAIIQDYIPLDEGEFSAGILKGKDGEVLSLIIYQRIFHNKLSIHYKQNEHIISSPYGQGFFDEYPLVKQAILAIAQKIQGFGPFNIQGRLKGGVFYPFEINPRFSGSVYMRCLAGVNEPDLLIQHLQNKKFSMPIYRKGLCLRSLQEVFIEDFPHD